MALHRDIFWIGRQWAVTGLGMQAINQTHGGRFDIAIDRLWDDDLLDAVRGQKWFNPDDFHKGLEIARARYPGRAPKVASPLPVAAVLQTAAAEPKPVLEPVAAKVTEPARPEAAPVVEPVAVAALEAAKPIPSFLQMKPAEHSARLVHVWRIEQRK